MIVSLHWHFGCWIGIKDLGVDSCVVFVGWMICYLVSGSSLVFCPKWPRVLVTDESSGAVGCLPWAFCGLRFLCHSDLWYKWNSLVVLDPSWLAEKPESSSWVPRTSLTSGRGAGTFSFLTGVDYTQTFVICSFKWWWIVSGPTKPTEVLGKGHLLINVSSYAWCDLHLSDGSLLGLGDRVQQQSGQGWAGMVLAWGRVSGDRIHGG